MARGNNQLFFVLFNEIILFDSHSWFFNLDQSMIVIKFIFAIAAKVEVFTEEALIPDSNNSELILTAGANNSMHQKFRHFLPCFNFLLLDFFFLGFRFRFIINDDSLRFLIKNPCS